MGSSEAHGELLALELHFVLHKPTIVPFCVLLLPHVMALLGSVPYHRHLLRVFLNPDISVQLSVDPQALHQIS